MGFPSSLPALAFIFFTDQPGEHTFKFAILHDVDKLVQLPTLIPDRIRDTPKILDLSLAFNPSYYSVKPSSPLGSFDHNLMSVISLQCSLRARLSRGGSGISTLISGRT